MYSRQSTAIYLFFCQNKNWQSHSIWKTTNMAIADSILFPRIPYEIHCRFFFHFSLPIRLSFAFNLIFCSVFTFLTELFRHIILLHITFRMACGMRSAVLLLLFYYIIRLLCVKRGLRFVCDDSSWITCAKRTESAKER